MPLRLLCLLVFCSCVWLTFLNIIIHVPVQPHDSLLLITPQSRVHCGFVTLPPSPPPLVLAPPPSPPGACPPILPEAQILWLRSSTKNLTQRIVPPLWNVRNPQPRGSLQVCIFNQFAGTDETSCKCWKSETILHTPPWQKHCQFFKLFYCLIDHQFSSCSDESVTKKAKLEGLLWSSETRTLFAS